MVRSSMSRCLAVFLSQSRLGFAGRACIANLLSVSPVTAMSGKKEGDVSDVLEAGSTLYAVRRSPARPMVKISPASAPSQARRGAISAGHRTYLLLISLGDLLVQRRNARRKFAA